MPRNSGMTIKMSMKSKRDIVPNGQVEKTYEPEVIPDRIDELMRKAEKARTRQREQALAERRHRENLKQKRILAAKEDKFTHAINLIIERTEYQKTKEDSFSINYHDFNFEDTMDESRVLEGLLEKLKMAGAIRNYSRQNYVGGTRFGFKEVDINKLREYKVHGGQISAKGFSLSPALPQNPPKGWRLEGTKDEARIIKNGKTFFSFLYTWTDKYTYFRCAWQRYNQKVSYKELYESKPDRKYPNKKGENWRVNDNIRATIRKLRDEFEKKKVPIIIETNKGIKAFVKE